MSRIAQNKRSGSRHQQARSPRLLFLVTEDWYFVSHRLPLAVAAARAGYSVAVATRLRDHAAVIAQAGIRSIPFELGRRAANPFTELGILWRLVRLYAREKPTVVYHVGMKPVIYGSLAAWFAGVTGRVNAIAGLGYVFTSRRLRARLLRPFLSLALRLLLGGDGCRVIVQNRDDQRVLKRLTGRDEEHVVFIPGAGVDLRRFTASPEPAGSPVILFAGRLLWDKGVGDFVAAAERLRGQGVAARFILAGAPDEGNPTAVPPAQIEAWQRTGAVQWLGSRDDMPAVIAASHVVCLPSAYGEGIPKILIEAAASARAIVASDIPGCREIVRHGVNGLLVPPRDIDALAQALATLIGDPEQRRAMGAAGRNIAEDGYGIEPVNEKSLAVLRAVTT